MSEPTYSTMIRYLREKDRYEILEKVSDRKEGESTLYLARRHRGAPRACLVTISDGTRVWFGISRCHEVDTFSRELGRKMADGRANFAREKYPNGTSFLQFEYQRLLGCTTMDKLDELLDLFYNLDKKIYSFLPRRTKTEEVIAAADQAIEEVRRRRLAVAGKDFSPDDGEHGVRS